MDAVVDRTALGRVEASNRCAHGVVGEAEASSARLAARKALTKGDLVDAAVEVGVPRRGWCTTLRAPPRAAMPREDAPGSAAARREHRPWSRGMSGYLNTDRTMDVRTY